MATEHISNPKQKIHHFLRRGPSMLKARQLSFQLGPLHIHHILVRSISQYLQHQIHIFQDLRDTPIGQTCRDKAYDLPGAIGVVAVDHFQGVWMNECPSIEGEVLIL